MQNAVIDGTDLTELYKDQTTGCFRLLAYYSTLLPFLVMTTKEEFGELLAFRDGFERKTKYDKHQAQCIDDVNIPGVLFH